MLLLRPNARALGIVLAGSAAAAPAAAQIDYRNLDRGRPLSAEDAYALERHAFELLVPLRTVRERGGERLHVSDVELEYGVLDNTQLGVGLPIAGSEKSDGRSVWGLAGIHLSALYNFTTEGPAIPGLAMGVDLALPIGGLAGDAARAGVRAIATRSWGLTRLHLNLTRAFGTDDLSGVEAAPRWSYGLAIDRTLFRRSLLLVGELLARRTVGGAPAELNAAAGIRYQVTPTLVLDGGIARRLRSRAGPDYDLTFGLSHVFAVPWLMPAGPR